MPLTVEDIKEQATFVTSYNGCDHYVLGNLLFKVNPITRVIEGTILPKRNINPGREGYAEIRTS